MASRDFAPQSALGLNMFGIMPGMAGIPMTPGMPMPSGIPMNPGMSMASGIPMTSAMPMSPGVPLSSMGGLGGMGGPTVGGPLGAGHYQVGGDTYSLPQRRSANISSNNKV